MILLDTDVISLVQREDSPEGLRVRARIAQLPKPEFPATTIITYEEQIRGWFAAMSQARDAERQIQIYARLLQHIGNYRKIVVLPYDRAAGDRYEQLKAMKLRMGAADLKIAAIALGQNATLLSRNLRDFAKVPGLRVEDWTT